MKQIRMKTLMAGPNGVRHPGEVCMISPEEAAVLIDGDYAEAVFTAEEIAAKPTSKKVEKKIEEK